MWTKERLTGQPRHREPDYSQLKLFFDVEVLQDVIY